MKEEEQQQPGDEKKGPNHEFRVCCSTKIECWGEVFRNEVFVSGAELANPSDEFPTTIIGLVITKEGF